MSRLDPSPANDNGALARFNPGDHFAVLTRSASVVSHNRQRRIAIDRSGALAIYGEVTDVEGDCIFGRCFSSACPTGEFGLTPIAHVRVRLSTEEFRRAEAAGWPNDKAAQRLVAGRR